VKLYRCLFETIKAAAVPHVRVNLKTRSSIWKDFPELKGIKNRAKFWLCIWIASGHQNVGYVFDIKKKTKEEFKWYLRSLRYNGSEFTKTASQWRQVINSSKLEPSASSGFLN